MATKISLDDVTIRFADGAFNRAMERTELGDTRRYTGLVAQMNERAEVLDRDDEFARLSLHPSDYAQVGTSDYGIPKMRVHIGDERLLPNQVTATERFLRELRGFGLLADVVGSGKTFEACAVLSELAAKGKITSLLLIVPSQVYNTWKVVLERRFGLGLDVLETVEGGLPQELLVRSEDGFLRPTKPVIVKTEDFVKWKEHDVQNVLFDAVVVDEAHNLCGEEGAEARAMKLLSTLMQTKKRAEKTYCVLLSATPHSGNLDRMFRLWYFVRCKGGNPTDFDEKDDSSRTEEYRAEKAHYRSRVCRDAETVMQFIENVRVSEVTVTHATAFNAFLAKNQEYPKVRSIADFRSALIGIQKKLIAEFMRENPDIAVKVNDAIASAYHDGVLRSIMIRQPNNNISKGKRIENVYFFPSHQAGSKVRCKGLKGEQITVDLAPEQSDKAVNGEYSLAQYVSDNQGNMSFRDAYASLFFNNGILAAFGLTDEDFGKANSVSFYWRVLEMGRAADATGDNDMGVQFLPLSANASVFEAKMAQLKALLRRHKDERVLVFFDYDIAKSERCYEEVLEALKQDPEFAERVLVGDASKEKDKIEKAFNDREDTVLVVTDNAFTEGANLQKSHVIVNFQVTPNPLSMEQRIGRIFRLGQDNDVVIYSLADMRALEGYALMYFTAIGLMNSNNGDAAIIAGSNNDNMVTIRCRACKRVKLLSREEYDELKQNNPEDLYCNATAACTQSGSRGVLMEEINSNEIKCSSCGSLIKRENDGRYHCFTHNESGRGVLCSTGSRGDRQLYCRKICVISHCKKFLEGELAGKCRALAKYRENPNLDDSALMEMCESCPHRKLCGQCRIGDGPEAIKKCMTCGTSNCRGPAPHVIDFDEKWSAPCPKCGEMGRLMPVLARTFETYIRSAYEYQQDGGRAFCDNLLRETEKVAEIKKILSNDKVRV